MNSVLTPTLARKRTRASAIADKSNLCVGITLNVIRDIAETTALVRTSTQNETMHKSRNLASNNQCMRGHDRTPNIAGAINTTSTGTITTNIDRTVTPTNTLEDAPTMNMIPGKW